jgi:hypothetical protein
MGYYLDKLIDKADDMILLSNDRDINDLFYHLRKLWTSSKQWLDQIVQDPACARDYSIGQPELNFMDILPSATGICVDFSGTQPCEEKWTDMLDLGFC